MPRDYPRSRRIGDQIQRELSDIIRVELKDPRVGMITITDVEVTQDQSHARIFFTVLGGQDRVEDTAHGLQHAAGFLRSQLAHRMKLRIVPQLQFKYDQSVERGMHLSQLIDAAVAEDAARATRTTRTARPRKKK
jgi:ribosome-binding factor A